jgi:D-alanyl-D-alanine carboxypeptidase (penicillin-binding protein 5/6)
MLIFAASCAAACASGATTITPPRATEEAAEVTATHVPPSPTPTPQPDILLPAAWNAPPIMGDTPPPPVTAAAVAVLDEASGALLYESASNDRRAPASLTKIATAIIALERGNLDAAVAVDVDSRTMTRSTVMGLIPGDVFTLRDLLYGMMLPSGNDAALAIGRHLAGSDAAFVAEMNALADRLGLWDTHFANPHGLGAPDHLTSARDIAMLSRYAMSVPGFAEIVATGTWTASGSRTLSFYNINGFLYTYPGADGLKTGYTRRAGQTIVASAMRNGHRLYVVLLNAPQREADARALMDWAFASTVWPASGVTR